MISEFKEKLVYFMKDTLSVLLPKNLLFHPILFVMIFLFGNITRSYETFQIYEIILTMAIILLFIIIAVFLTLLIYKEKDKAVIIASLLVIAIFFYDDIYNSIYPILERFFVRKNLTLGIALFSLLIVVGWVLKKVNKSLHVLNRYITIMALFILLFDLGHATYDIVYAKDLFDRYLPNKPGPVLDNKNYNRKNLPDVYYIILDSYTSSESLKKYWLYDNEDFTNKLQTKGFFIAHKSESAYTNTDLSIASSLNMSYLSGALINIPTFKRIRLTNKIIRTNEVVKKFEEYSYNIFNYSIFTISKIPRFTSFSITYSANEGSFAVNMFDKTIFGSIIRLWNMPDVASVNLNIIDKLKQLPDNKTPGPKFVYAHLMLPHFPYQFDENGKITSANKLRYEGKNKDKYLKQLKYTNKLIINLVDNILIKSKKPPIIIIQGDHGFRYLDSEEGKKESHTILNAYFLPKGEKCALYDNISPINTFRAIFNCYFGTNYELIKEEFTQ